MGGGPVDLVDQRLDPEPGVVPLLLGEGDARPLGQEFERLDIPEVLNPHDKADHVPARPAAEAVKGLALVVDVEGRGLLRVERAEPLARPPGTAQLDIGGDDLPDIAAHFQLVQKTLWNGQSIPSFPV